MSRHLPRNRLLTGAICALALTGSALISGCGSIDIGRHVAVAPAVHHQPPTLQASGSMSDYMTSVFNDVSQFWTRELQAAGEPAPHPAYAWIAPGQSVKESCDDGDAGTDDTTAEYCDDDKTLYFSQAAAEQIWHGKFVANQDRVTGKSGDFSVAYVIAHEYAHSVQDALGIFAANPNLPSKPFELQADCLAGVWAHAAYDKGELGPDSIDQAVTATEKFGDYDVSDPDHHGTPGERRAAFMLGYNTGQGSQCTLSLGSAGTAGS